MATRGTIAIQNADGTVTGIYTHWDSYLSNNGRILQDHYQDEAKVRELIALGDLSSLGPNIGDKHDFNSAADYPDCTFYGRDRGEKNVDAQTCANWDQLIEDFGQEYDYLFVPGTGWRVRYFADWDRVEMSLDEALAMEVEN